MPVSTFLHKVGGIFDINATGKSLPTAATAQVRRFLHIRHHGYGFDAASRCPSLALAEICNASVFNRQYCHKSQL